MPDIQLELHKTSINKSFIFHLKNYEKLLIFKDYKKFMDINQ